MKRFLLSIVTVLLATSAHAAPLTQQLVRIYPSELSAPVDTGTSTPGFSWTSLVNPLGLSSSYNGEKFRVSSEGLYVFDAFDPYMTMYPSVIYDDYNMWGNYIFVNPGNVNIDTFMGSIGKLIGYGAEDKGLTIAQRKVQMRSRLIWLQCGDTSETAISLLADQGINARRVHLLARETAATANNRDDGHVAMEVWDGTDYRIYDPTIDGYYADSGSHISALELHDLGMSNAEFVRFAPTEVTGGYIGSNQLLSSGPPPRYSTPFQIRNYFDINLGTEAKVEAWRERIYSVYGWAHPTNGEIWWLDDGLTTDQKNWITSLSAAYKIKTRAQIITQFYPHI